MRSAFLSDLTATILAMPIALFPVINEERFDGSPEVLGLLIAAVAVGGVLASALSGLVTRHGRTSETSARGWSRPEAPAAPH